MRAERNTVGTYPENAPDLGYQPVPDICKEDIYVADTLNWRVQKLVKKE